MARLGIHTILVTSEDREEKLEVKFVVNVNTEGLFTTTLDEKDVRIIKTYGVELDTNGRQGGRFGFFSGNTLKELCISIKEVLEVCLSRELIESKIVLRYTLSTACSFGFTKDSKIIPNMGWTIDGAPDLERHWQSGTVDTHATNQRPTGIQLYVRPYIKETYQYKSGDRRIKYQHTTVFGSSQFDDNQYHLQWLEAICSTTRPKDGTLQEIDYTEERAKFFVDLYKSLCLIAHKIAKFENPQEMIQLIESKGNLLAQ